MAFDNFEEDYGKVYHTYPLYSQESTIEGAFKRFGSMPQPLEILNYALLGLPKYFPLTNEQITVDGPVPIGDYLTSAITDIEMELGCNLSEVTHLHSEDYIDGMFTSNFMGIRLQNWPATKIEQIILKYPHTNTTSTYQTYTIPPAWVYLRRNKVNIVAAVGSIVATSNNPSVATAGGIFTYITGFGRGIYQPGSIEVKYTAGFEHDKLPGVLVDLVKTWAAHNYLTDIGPSLFPSNSVSVAIDGVSQSVGYNIPQAIQTRTEALGVKKERLKATFRKAFARTIGMSFIGA